MLILSVNEVRPHIDEVGNFCSISWVYEGTAHKEDLLTCAIVYKTWNYGLDDKKENMRWHRELMGLYPIQMTIKRIRKYKDWKEMPAGYSGFFNFDATDETVRTLLEYYVPWERKTTQATLENPICDLDIALADTEASARLYFNKIIEHDFNPLTP